jgi:hypothetical protein
MLIVSAIGVFIAQGVQWRNHLQRIESRGKLIVAVRESEGIFWANGQEFTGFEKDLIDELERELEAHAVRLAAWATLALIIGAWRTQIRGITMPPAASSRIAIALAGVLGCRRSATQCGVLTKQCRSGSAIGSGGAAVRSWQWEPQWGSVVRDDSTQGMHATLARHILESQHATFLKVSEKKSARRAWSRPSCC